MFADPKTPVQTCLILSINKHIFSGLLIYGDRYFIHGKIYPNDDDDNNNHNRTWKTDLHTLLEDITTSGRLKGPSRYKRYGRVAICV